MTDEAKRARQREATRRYRERHPERERENRAKRPSQSTAKQSEYQRAYRLRHHARLLVEEAAWRAANPDKIRAQNHRPGAAEKRRVAGARWRAENLERVRREHAEYMSRRRALIRGSEAEPVDRAAIIARDKSRCHLCGKRVAKSDLTLDHLIPVALGGPHTAANLAVAHRSCNGRKWINAANEQLRLVG